MKYSIEDLQQKIHTRQLEGIGERLEEDIAGCLNRAGIYFRIFNRAKSPDSIIRKLEKSGYGFGEDEKKMQDLIGLRVVVYYQDDMRIIREILEQTFRRVGEWSMTTTTDEEFKASKVNGVFRIPNEYQQLFSGDLTEYPIDATFEVQLRTVSFEAWHEIEHDMRYKSPYGDAFWENNEDLSRTLNCVLANLELCDWSTLSVFDKLSSYHFTQKNWEMMMKSRFRLRFDREPLAPELIAFLNDNLVAAYDLFQSSRADIIFALMQNSKYEKLTYNLLVKAFADLMEDKGTVYQRRLFKICKEVLANDKVTKPERVELSPLDVTPSFRLNVTLSHEEGQELDCEFSAAVSMIASWAQSKFKNLTDDIPLDPVDYEFHMAGYDLQILGNRSLGFYKLSLENLDTDRKGVVWRTKVSLEMSERIRMKVDCDYCHTPDRLVRDGFSKPRFVDEIFRRIGYEDVKPMSLKPQKVSTFHDFEEVSAFIANHNRSLPVIMAVEDDRSESQVNISRLAETVGAYAHVYLVDKEAVPTILEQSDYTEEELVGSVWVTFTDGQDKFYTRKMIEETRFDYNRYAFDRGNVAEKAFRHKLVRMLKEKNCQS